MHNGDDDDDDGESKLKTQKRTWDLTTAALSLWLERERVCVRLAGKGAVLAGRALVGAQASAPVLDVVVPAAAAECEKAALGEDRRKTPAFVGQISPKSWTKVAVEIRF